jgi:hypothetical protein
MRRSHHTPGIIGEQQRQAICHHDGASNMCILGDASVCLSAIRGGGIELGHIHTMHLS